ncbi:MAG: hypothetical protein IJX18_02130 [Clostridia bacterium]|nr:hypothetical protein [Clostridia bacterium]
MSLEQDFHNFIEAQNPEEKQRGIARVQAARAALEATPIPKRPFSWKRFLAVAAPSVAAFGVGVVLVVNLIPQGDGTRYCASSDYTAINTTQTLQEYASENNLPILHLDWYSTSDYISHDKYQLADGEVVGFVESRATFEGYFINFTITERNTTLEDLANFENLENSSTIDETNISYGSISRLSYATFTYGDYRYYLQVEFAPTYEYVLELAELLLPDGE